MTAKGSIPKTWMLLHSQLIINVFSSADLLTNIHPTTTTVHIKCNAGTKSTNLQGTHYGYREVCCFADAIANILSLICVQKKF